MQAHKQVIARHWRRGGIVIHQLLKARASIGSGENRLFRGRKGADIRTSSKELCRRERLNPAFFPADQGLAILGHHHVSWRAARADFELKHGGQSNVQRQAYLATYGGSRRVLRAR
jgi:hypothetical protein